MTAASGLKLHFTLQKFAAGIGIGSLCLAATVLAAEPQVIGHGSTTSQPTSRPSETELSPKASSTVASPSALPTNTPPPAATDEKALAIRATVLNFWAFANQSPKAPHPRGSVPGLTVPPWNSLRKRLLNEGSLPTREDEDLLRQPFSELSAAGRFRARAKLVRSLEVFSSASGSLGPSLVEALIAWGEARNLTGFRNEDSLVQQAKIAAILHVLRNRVRRACESRKTWCEKNPQLAVLAAATRRFQFTAFEPYDPNLAELGFGPNTVSANTRSLPELDEKALQNISQVLAKMELGEISFKNPLSSHRTRHYLTPQLLPNTASNLNLAQATANDANRRTRLLQIPGQRPQYLALVPMWAEQHRLIAEPAVDFVDTSSQSVQTIPVQPQDFVFFIGVR
jgi:hypothetical protein